MNYDLCDALNRKLLKIHGIYTGNWTGNSNYKHPQDYDKTLDEIDSEKFTEYTMLLGEENNIPNIYGHWIYRDGKLSGLVNDHEFIAKKIFSEGFENRSRGAATTELLNLSGVIKLLVNPGKSMYLECFTRPSLDQLMTLKDIERPILANDGMIAWRIFDRKGKGIMHEGTSLEKMHSLPWSKVR